MNSSVLFASSCRLRASCAHLDVRRQDLRDLGDEPRGRDAGLPGDADLVELAVLAEQLLRRRQIEAGERRPADRADGAELDDARDPEVLDRALDLDAERRADLEVLLARGRLVDDDLVRRRPCALDERQARELRLRRVDGEPEVRRAAEDDRLAVLDELRVLGRDPADRVGDVRQLLAPSRGATRRTPPRSCPTGPRGRTPTSTGDRRVGALVDVREDRVERLVDRVGEDERAADRRDAEDDRDRGERRPQLAGQQALEREADHSYCSASSGFSLAALRAGVIAASSPDDHGEDDEEEQLARADLEANVELAERPRHERRQGRSRAEGRAQLRSAR